MVDVDFPGLRKRTAIDRGLARHLAISVVEVVEGWSLDHVLCVRVHQPLVEHLPALTGHTMAVLWTQSAKEK